MNFFSIINLFKYIEEFQKLLIEFNNIKILIIISHLGSYCWIEMKAIKTYQQVLKVQTPYVNNTLLILLQILKKKIRLFNV